VATAAKHPRLSSQAYVVLSEGSEVLLGLVAMLVLGLGAASGEGVAQAAAFVLVGITVAGNVGSLTFVGFTFAKLVRALRHGGALLSAAAADMQRTGLETAASTSEQSAAVAETSTTIEHLAASAARQNAPAATRSPSPATATRRQHWPSSGCDDRPMASREIVATAAHIADEVLFPAAAATDASPIVPVENLDALAAAGLYGLSGPLAAGGLDADLDTACAAIETLAGGCLSTAFVWVQHLGAVLGVAFSETPGLADEWLTPMCRGERRAGIALAGLLAGRPGLRAARVDGGWRLSGIAPWVTAWGLIDVVHTAGRDEEGNVVLGLVEARSSETLAASPPLDLVAVRASATVRLELRDHFVPDGLVTSVRPPAPGGEVEVLRIHSALVLGVAARCLRLLGESALDEELDARRAELAAATAETVHAARAAASELALRAASALVVASGSGSLLAGEHAQRLAREALFLSVFGGRAPVRDELLGLLGARLSSHSDTLS
jgi:alkylation response protein AidB-like acyl-CoA dehydrogenase